MSIFDRFLRNIREDCGASQTEDGDVSMLQRTNEQLSDDADRESQRAENHGYGPDSHIGHIKAAASHENAIKAWHANEGDGPHEEYHSQWRDYHNKCAAGQRPSMPTIPKVPKGVK